jgi:hypothetical protein
MKRETLRHPKSYDLASRLGVSKATALGHLILLWDFVGEYATRGDVGKYSDGVIARACDWAGNPTEFTAALVGSGWLDLDEQCRLLVHDWLDHCEQWVSKRLEREAAAKSGKKPEKKEVYGQRPAGGLPTNPNQTNPNQSNPTTNNQTNIRVEVGCPVVVEELIDFAFAHPERQQCLDVAKACRLNPRLPKDRDVIVQIAMLDQYRPGLATAVCDAIDRQNARIENRLAYILGTVRTLLGVTRAELNQILPHVVPAEEKAGAS